MNEFDWILILLWTILVGLNVVLFVLNLRLRESQKRLSNVEHRLMVLEDRKDLDQSRVELDSNGVKAAYPTTKPAKAEPLPVVSLADILNHPDFVRGGKGQVVVGYEALTSDAHSEALFYEKAIREKAFQLGLEIMVDSYQMDGSHFYWRPETPPSNFS